MSETSEQESGIDPDKEAYKEENPKFNELLKGIGLINVKYELAQIAGETVPIIHTKNLNDLIPEEELENIKDEKSSDRKEIYLYGPNKTNDGFVIKSSGKNENLKLIFANQKKNFNDRLPVVEPIAIINITDKKVSKNYIVEQAGRQFIAWLKDAQNKSPKILGHASLLFSDFILSWKNANKSPLELTADNLIKHLLIIKDQSRDEEKLVLTDTIVGALSSAGNNFLSYILDNNTDYIQALIKRDKLLSDEKVAQLDKLLGVYRHSLYNSSLGGLVQYNEILKEEYDFDILNIIKNKAELGMDHVLSQIQEMCVNVEELAKSLYPETFNSHFFQDYKNDLQNKILQIKRKELTIVENVSRAETIDSDSKRLLEEINEEVRDFGQLFDYEALSLTIKGNDIADLK